MRLHRFFISEPVGNKTELTIHSAELANQIRRVFRLKTGDSVIIFDGSGFDYECRIADSSASNEKDGKNLACLPPCLPAGRDRQVTFDVTSSMRSRFMPARDIYLCAAVVKKDTFEWIVEKAAELGVTHIIPIMAERSEKKSLNEKRLKKIAIEASEQSGRGSVPVIQLIMGLKGAVEHLKKGLGRKEKEDTVQLIAFHTEGESFNPQDIPKDIPIAVFIGPEGGWSIDEISLFHKNDVPVYCLGSQVMRSETAVVAALSHVVFSK